MGYSRGRAVDKVTSVSIGNVHSFWSPEFAGVHKAEHDPVKQFVVTSRQHFVHSHLHKPAATIMPLEMIAINYLTHPISCDPIRGFGKEPKYGIFLVVKSM